MNSKRRLATFDTILLGTLCGALGHTQVAAAATCAEAKAAPSALVMVLLDRSGSMFYDGQCRDGSVDRKWVCGLQDVNQWISNNDPYQERAYFLWQFRTIGSDPEIVDPDNGTGTGYCRDEAVTRLVPTGRYEGPLFDDAATPLAGAYCDAVQAMLQYREDNGWFDIPIYVKLESDGLENDTPSLKECFGTDGGTDNFVYHDAPVIDETAVPPTVDGVAIGSWQAKMYDKAITGVVHPYPPLHPDAWQRSSGTLGNMPIITNVTFLDEFIGTTAAPLAARLMAAADGAVSEDGVKSVSAMMYTVASAAAVSSDDGLVSFFGGLAELRDSRVTRFGSGEAIPPGDPTGYHVIPADANDSGCVDSADFLMIQQFYGLEADVSNPNTILADINADGVVGSGDYLMLKAHWGEGCATPPGSVPVLGNALFGMEDLSRWTSGSPLSITSKNASEGMYSLVFGGTGFRTVSSTKFSTTLFKGVTSKLALDVLIPVQQSNPYWLGQVILYVSAPSAGINNLALGNVELTGRQRGVFTQATFNLPLNVRNAMRTPRSDFSIKVAINANDPGYQIDNIRFVN